MEERHDGACLRTMKDVKRQDKTDLVAVTNKLAWNIQACLKYEKPLVGEAITIPSYRRAYLTILSFLETPKELSALDVGCGTGIYLEWLLEDFNYTVGIDISPNMIKSCKERIGKNPLNEFLVADAQHLPFRKDVFDIATVVETLHHFPEPMMAMKEIARVSKRVALYEPNHQSCIHRIINHFRILWLDTLTKKGWFQTDFPYSLVEFHSEGFSSADLTSYFLTVGMTVVEITTFGFMGLVQLIRGIPKKLLYFLPLLEDTLRMIPIIRWQLSDILAIGTKNTTFEVNQKPKKPY